MREVNKISESLFEKIRDRFEDVSLGDAEANAVTDPEKARFFNFDYTVDGKNYGNITISLVDELSLKVYYSKNITQNLDTVEKQKWYGFLKELREFSKRNMLSFEPRDITRPTLKHRDIKQVSKADDTFDKDDVLAEGHMYGTNRTSYENSNNVRIMVRHSDAIDPERRGARSRKIKSIFLETSDGERFKLPMNSLSYARAMARHIAEGGTMHDEFGQHISNIAEECSKLRPFRAAMSRRVFEDEETQSMVEAAFEYHGQLKHTLSKMAGPKGYKQCKEEFAVKGAYISEEDVDVASIKERFVKRVFNDRMEGALPIVQKAYNMKKENKYAKQFESWASTVAEGTWAIPDSDETIEELRELLANELPLGVDAVNATSALYNIIGDDSLFDLLGNVAEEDPDADARPIVLSWLQDNMPEVLDKVSTGEDEYELGGELDEEKVGLQEDEWDDADDSVNSIVSAITNRILRQHSDLLSKLGPEKLMALIQDEAEYAAPVQEIGSSDVSGWIKNIYQAANIEPQLAEDSSKPFGLRYKMFAGRDDRIVTKEKWFKTEEQRERFAEKIQDDGKFYEIDSYGSLNEDEWDDRLTARLRKKGYSDSEQSKMGTLDALKGQIEPEGDAELPSAKSVMRSMFGGDANELTKGLKIKEGQLKESTDYVKRHEKLKRMGAKPLGMVDKLKNIPRGMKAMAKGDSEDDLALYNKGFVKEDSSEIISQWGIYPEEWVALEDAVDHALANIQSEEDWDGFVHNLNGLDDTLSGAVEDGLGSQDREHFMTAVLNALRTGQQHYGTEPRAAVDRLTWALTKAKPRDVDTATSLAEMRKLAGL